ncbi:hypothetical protein CPC16_003813 [Podila verticillata]|uniref:Uncharacterized protein n=1 Tax=Podila verticillata NRRL 6337 TaxID=1069443 RepID=A0A086TLF4_9FUNG|nr:hypothetical protein CPC16_003813 [Podila verticillata]KAI9240777.1 MAG: hypothetical protein BYD32DRAFT_407342 [Podila humilis]KFH62781.1 hypothetical protein MVEG_11307 [Podila verticillata NRRL 6337]
MNDVDRHPSCVHSLTHHNSMSMSSDQAGACSCEECGPYKMPITNPFSEQASVLQGTSYNTTMSNTNNRSMGSNATSMSPPTTYLARRPSTNLAGATNMAAGGQGSAGATSPRMAPAGFVSPVSMGHLHQRRSSCEYSNAERVFMQHSTACDCRGSGVGCGCSFTCDC